MLYTLTLVCQFISQINWGEINQWLPEVRGEMNTQNIEGFEDSENTLCINATLDMYHYTFVQNHRM